MSTVCWVNSSVGPLGLCFFLLALRFLESLIIRTAVDVPYSKSDILPNWKGESGGVGGGAIQEQEVEEK